MARKPITLPSRDAMQLRLRCTSVIPHANNTSSVTLAEPMANFPPTPRIIEASAPGPQLRISPGPPIPAPAPKPAVQVMLTNIPTSAGFSVGREYTVDISPA